MSNKLEINIRSLIAHCEELANDDVNSWRLKKYIKSLITMVDELDTSPDKPNANMMDEYINRCTKLRKATNYVESPKLSRKLKPRPKDAIGSGETVIREINQIHNSNYNKELRAELMGTDDSATTLRKRVAASGGSGGGSENMGQASKYYEDMQERIAEDMLTMTRSLKEQTETANKIIRRDTEIVTSSAHLSDKNFLSLEKEAEKLDEHSKKAWKCWMWIMIGLVMVIFMFMVLFMKIMKKKA